MTATAPATGLRLVARFAGPLLFFLILALGPRDLDPQARRTLGVAAWMVTWWITECVPILVTSLLPIVLFPLLGITGTREAAAPYANDLVFLFLAGFLLAAALERWESHARIAYRLVLLVGLSGRRVVLGIMIATAFLSMWISNTATAAMMYPIAIAIGGLFASDDGGRNARTAIMLGVAYAASIGGMATLIGTPPNLVVAGAMRELTQTGITFAQFMLLGMPLVVILLPLCWALLVFVVFPARAHLGDGADRMLRERLAGLGPVRGGEARVLLIFAVAAVAWILRERKEFGGFALPGLVDLFPRISDAAIGVGAALMLFIVNGHTRAGDRRPLLTWEEARGIPWDVLLFFGGGLSLAHATEASGLTTWFAGGLSHLGGYSPAVIYLGLAVAVLALSELASNLAVATMMMPIAVALGQSTGLPAPILMLVAGFAASTGFALPIATPPNTIVFGSGMISVRQMAKAGIFLDLVAVVVIVVIIGLLGPVVVK